jgi:hypothetical protein
MARRAWHGTLLNLLLREDRMPKYKVFGSRTAEYYVIVEAADPDEAYDIASGDYVKWSSIDTDEVIEPFEVQLLDSPDDHSIQLTLDEDIDWPKMGAGIIIEGKS